MKRGLKGLALVAATVVALTAATGSASALQRVETASFGRQGSTGSEEFGNEISVAAFDQTNRRLYSREVIYGLRGWSVPTPGTYLPLGPPWPIDEAEGPAETMSGIAVDNTGLATNGRFYGAQANSGEVTGYNPDGTPLGAPFPLEPAEPTQFSNHLCGAAVDSTGTILVGNDNATGAAEGRGILRFSPDGTELPPIDTTSVPGAPCNLALDASDNLYITTTENEFRPGTTGAVWKLTKASNYTNATLFSPDPATTIAVDKATGHVFVARLERVTEYDSAGNIVGEFGNDPGSPEGKRFFGVAVDEANNEVFVADSHTYNSEFIIVNNEMRVFSAPEAVKPEAVSKPATAVTRDEATLHGEVDPAGGAGITECVFEYGTTTEYGETFPCTPEASGGAPLTTSTVVEASLTSAQIEPQTLYHFRVKATSADGTHVGVDETFTTLPAVFETETEAATGTTETSAVLNGSFNANGFNTTYYFEYGTDTEYGSKVPLPAPPGEIGGNANMLTPVSKEITGLETNETPVGKEYDYRIVAENSFGVTYGKNVVFHTQPHVKHLATLPATEVRHNKVTLDGEFDPNGEATQYYFEWGTTIAYGKYAPVAPPGADGGETHGVKTVSTVLFPVEPGVLLHYRLVATNVHGKTIGEDLTVHPDEQPTITHDRATKMNTDTALLEAFINPNALETTYHWEYGTEDCSVGSCTHTEEKSIGSGVNDVQVSLPLSGLTPGATYYFRLISQNSRGTTTGRDFPFTTFLPQEGGDTCSNILVRKQTGATIAPHCRAYELVSAANAGGYDVESNLIAGLHPLPGFPRAHDKVLYTTRYGAIPGSGNPTNRGGDPYLAERTSNGWVTHYVGLQANGTASTLPFSSTLAEAGQGLEAFAFGGPEICDPCFGDGSQNIPLRVGDGEIEKGMAGSENPAADPAGQIDKLFSADGKYFVFGSTSRFEPAGNQGSLSIYERDLGASPPATQVVSTMPDGSTMPGAGTAELDISEDGSRVLIGRQVGTDAAGNRLYDLYMHVGEDPHSVQVADTAHGVLYDGMTGDGSTVYFTTADSLADDTDASADLFRADVTSSGATVTRVSTGIAGAGNTNACDPVASDDGNHWNEPGSASSATCGVVAIAGGGGVASDSGTVYFLSPEQLDGSSGTANQPNLYLANPGSAPEFVATLDPDDVAVHHGVSQAGTRDTADFQTTPDGSFAVFASAVALTGAATDSHNEIYRSETAGPLECVSCAPTNGAPSSDTDLTSGGLNLADDGRVFFTSAEQLVLRDTNRLEDAYEWDEGKIGIISTGLDTTDSGLLTASADGKDAFFFTRQSLAPQDENGGAMKIYDAREGGGFLFNPAPPPCVASDECHGPGSQSASPPAINTIEGTEEAEPPVASQPGEKPRKRCRKGFVKRHGKCVKKHARHAHHKAHGHGGQR